jgi:hypothetical protein
MVRKPIDAAGNETNTTQTVHRSLHRSRITKNIFTLGSCRYASHPRIVARASTETSSRVRVAGSFKSQQVSGLKTWLAALRVLAEYRTAVLAKGTYQEWCWPRLGQQNGPALRRWLGERDEVRTLALAMIGPETSQPEGGLAIKPTGTWRVSCQERRESVKSIVQRRLREPMSSAAGALRSSRVQQCAIPDT